MLLCYGLNDCDVVASDDALFELIMSVADGTLTDVELIAKELRSWEHPRWA